MGEKVKIESVRIQDVLVDPFAEGVESSPESLSLSSHQVADPWDDDGIVLDVINDHKIDKDIHDDVDDVIRKDALNRCQSTDEDNNVVNDVIGLKVRSEEISRGFGDVKSHHYNADTNVDSINDRNADVK